MKFILALLLLIPSLAFAAFDYSPTNQTSLGNSGFGTCEDFPITYPQVDGTIYLLNRSGNTREADNGVIIGRQFTYPSTWSGVSEVYSRSGKDCMNPRGGVIGSTYHTFINCKDSPSNVNTILVHGYRSTTPGSTWTFEDIFDPSGTGTANGWGDLVSTSDSSTFFLPLSQNGGDGNAISQIRTTDGGSTWSTGPAIVASPSYWSEASCVHIGGGKILCWVRNDNGAYVHQITSSDNGLTWTAPASTGLGASTGVKISHLYYDQETAKVIGIFQDRGNGYDIFFSATPADRAFNNAWNPAIYLFDQGGHMEMEQVLKTSTDKRFLWVNGYDVGGGTCVVQWAIYRNLFQKLKFTGNLDVDGSIYLDNN